MIQLRPDCMIFKTSDGEQFPCSAEWVAFELMGDNALEVDPEVVRNASAAVLHYFKNEMNQDFVSISDFAQALGKVLGHLGVHLKNGSKGGDAMAIDSDLVQLALEAGDGWELCFFPRLRADIKHNLEKSPQMLRFRGLRDCVKHLAGTPRWNRRCQDLNDQIVDYVRTCWSTEVSGHACTLVVS